MILVMVLLCLVVLGLLLIVSGVVPKRARMSTFELERRKQAGDKHAVAELRREALLGDITSLQKGLAALFLVIFSALSVATWGWLLGVIIALVVALEYGALARIQLIQRQSQKIYDRYEPHLLRFTEKFARFFKIIRSAPAPEVTALRSDSREELVHIISQSGHLISADEKKLLEHGLSFGERLVSEVMTPRGVIEGIEKNELLGPLVLDDLHKTGHSRFPVIDGDIDHVVGMLHIQNLFSLDAKRSVRAETAMEPRVFYIREDQTLQHALAAFVRTHHHLFIVINEFRETVGVISLEDVIEALLGRKIVDEFDTHEDLRVVAARNPRGNNHPKKREDV